MIKVFLTKLPKVSFQEDILRDVPRTETLSLWFSWERPIVSLQMQSRHAKNINNFESTVISTTEAYLMFCELAGPFSRLYAKADLSLPHWVDRVIDFRKMTSYKREDFEWLRSFTLNNPTDVFEQYENSRREK